MASEEEFQEAIEEIDTEVMEDAEGIDYVDPEDIEVIANDISMLPGMSIGHANAKKIAKLRKAAGVKEKQRTALQMRLSGLTYRAIAEALGYKAEAGAWAAVKSAMNDYNLDDTRELAIIQFARLESLFMVHWPKAVKGDENAAAICLSIHDRISRMKGLDNVDLGRGGTEGAQGVLTIGGDKDNYMASLRKARKQLKGNS